MSEFPVWVDGVFHPAGTPVLAAEDAACTEARSVFETMRVEGGHIEWRNAHLERLGRGAAAVGLGPADPSALEAALGAFVERLATEAGAAPSFALRLMLAATDGAGRSTRTLLTARPLPAPLPSGAELWCDPDPVGAGALSRLKSSSRLALALARDRALERGADEALLFDAAGRVVEGSVSNVFLALAGRVVTPALGGGGLAGIVRAVLLEGAAGLAPAPVEGLLTMKDLAAATEVVLTNSLRGVLAVKRLRGEGLERTLPGPAGPVARVLSERFRVRCRAERAAVSR